MSNINIALGLVLAVLFSTPHFFATGAQAAEDAKTPIEMEWSFQGPLGTYDRNALRRGYQVYKEVCAACHGLKHVYFRNLSQAGGPEFTEAEVKALAAQYQMVEGPDKFGDMFERAGLPRDAFPEPYDNDNAARAANGGSLPPDLSLINKARGAGADYIYSLLIGYEPTPKDMEMRAGLYYNPYMPGGRIAMPAPLLPEIVDYSDGTTASVEQMALDVTHFLQWAAEPELEARHRMGVIVIIYLSIFAGLMYFTNRKIWKSEKV